MESKSHFLLSTLALAGILVSCTDEPVITYGEFEDRGAVEEASVTMSVPQSDAAFKAVWEDNDAIAIFEPGTPSNPRIFQLEEGAGTTEGTFAGNLPVYEDVSDKPDMLSAIWPYDWYAGSTSSSKAYSLSVPTVQTADDSSTEYIAGCSEDSGETFMTRQLISILEFTVTGLPEDETLESLAFSSASGVFASGATVNLTTAELPVTVSEYSTEISSGIVSGNKISFRLLPQDFKGIQAEINAVITTDKAVYNQKFDGFSDIVTEAGKTVSATIEIADQFGEGGFVFAEDETARPGEGEYAYMHVIPIRGEILDNETLEPYTFIPNTASGTQTLRIWFVSLQDATVGKYFSLKDFSGSLGFDNTAVAEEFYTGSTISVTDKNSEYDANRHYFFEQNDALKYKISYVDFDIDAKFALLFSDEFRLGCTIVGSKDGSGSFLSEGEEMTVPVTVHASPYILQLGEDESARPGIGEYDGYNFLPIRGEYITKESKNKLEYTPFTFTAGQRVGQSNSEIAFRVWMISRKDYGAPTDNSDKYVSENDWGTTYLLGAEMAEIEEKFGPESGIGFGTAASKKMMSGLTGYVFDNEEDNNAYIITYIDYDVKTPSNKNLPERFKSGYVLKNAATAPITMHLKKDSSNKDSNAPETLTFTVPITCVAAQ